ncbi:LON peptidase substrate-binding domain-containing protein [Mesorhizobium sp.]|uniref:LON peptidase substrate-binding domain-containing protein n=1 Tax=Mesorhizobium sp. TaxID=1871066 RepID=UPI00258CCE67|nr:LON peptidase substrate-binding domain-containing protein [Mesorhizobium sp.]
MGYSRSRSPASSEPRSFTWSTPTFWRRRSRQSQRRQSAEAVARSNAVLDTYQSYANIDFSSLPRRAKARLGLPSIGDPGVLADTLAPLLSISIEQKQQLLETSDVVARLEKILDLMKAGRPENGPEPAG